MADISKEPKLEHLTAPLLPKMRPAEKVRSFIFQQATRSPSEGAWRMPSMRQMATHLDVSVTTVQSVYRDLSREGYIYADSNRGSFFNPRQAEATDRAHYIGLAFVTDTFELSTSMMGSIYTGMLKSSLRLDGQLKFTRFSFDARGIQGIKQARSHDQLDGMIVLSGNLAKPIERLCRDLGIPIVHLLPPLSNSTENFVCADIISATAAATDALLRWGRKRIALVEQPSNDSIPYNTLVFTGITQTLREQTDSISALTSVYFQNDDTQDRLALERVLSDKKNRPDAILFGDLQVHVVMQAVKNCGLRIPEDISLIATEGLSWTNTEYSTMTRILQPFDQIGEELIQMTQSLISSPNLPLPGKYLPCTFGGGSTTTAKENAALGI